MVFVKPPFAKVVARAGACHERFEQHIHGGDLAKGLLPQEELDLLQSRPRQPRRAGAGLRRCTDEVHIVRRPGRELTREG